MAILLDSDAVSSARGAQKIFFVANLVASFVDSALLCSTKFATKLATKFGSRAEPAIDSDPVTTASRRAGVRRTLETLAKAQRTPRKARTLAAPRSSRHLCELRAFARDSSGSAALGKHRAECRLPNVGADIRLGWSNVGCMVPRSHSPTVLQSPCRKFRGLTFEDDDEDEDDFAWASS